MHDLALSVVREKGRTSTSVWEYRHGLLDIEYRPDRGQLDVWFDRRVLSIRRSHHNVQVLRYVPGYWELDLIRAAKVAA